MGYFNQWKYICQRSLRAHIMLQPCFALATGAPNAEKQPTALHTALHASQQRTSSGVVGPLSAQPWISSELSLSAYLILASSAAARTAAGSLRLCCVCSQADLAAGGGQDG